MLRQGKAGLVAASGLTLAATLTACGNPITANHDWRSLTALVTVTEQVDGHTVTGVALAGPLVDSQGRPVAKTAFEETCAKVSGSGTTFRCLTLIYTGPKAYFAGGMAAGPFGTLKSLATPATTGTISITKLSGSQAASKPVLIKISAVKG
jgi:hypothetical protein